MRIVGEDKTFRAEVEKAMKAASTDCPLIITGETGTGKDLLARHIHAWSKRRNEPFKVVSCGNLKGELLEVELFGSERGAFTGAVAKRGLVEETDGGVLFLNEIDLISPTVQGKLLRFVDEGRFRRVGGMRDREVDVRLITATNADLRGLVEEGRFRRDLYHRLRVIEIHLPPLRDRGDDVILLARYFLEEICASQGVPRKRLTSEAESVLLSHRWDGNVRELRNLMERLMVLCDEEVITKDTLLEHMELREKRKVEIRFSKIPSLDEVIEEYLRVVLEEMGGKKKPAARAMRISLNRLKRLMEKHGI